MFDFYFFGFLGQNSTKVKEGLGQSEIGILLLALPSFFLPIQTDCVAFQTYMAETVIYPPGV